MTDGDIDDALRSFKRKVFGDSTASVPRVFLNVLRRSLPPTAHAVGNSFPERNYHSVSWLYGSAFGIMSSEGSNDDSNAEIAGVILPLSDLKAVKIGVEKQDYDPELRRVTRWTRRATFNFGGKELHFSAVETPEGSDRTGEFIDRVLLAMSALGQTS
jgi:hypothetical protein